MAVVRSRRSYEISSSSLPRTLSKGPAAYNLTSSNRSPLVSNPPSSPLNNHNRISSPHSSLNRISNSPLHSSQLLNGLQPTRFPETMP